MKPFWHQAASDEGGSPDRGNRNRRNVPLPPSRGPQPGRNMLLMILMALLIGFFIMSLFGSGEQREKIIYSKFLSWVRNSTNGDAGKRIVGVKIMERRITVDTTVINNLTQRKTNRYYTIIPYMDPDLLPMLKKHNIPLEGLEKPNNGILHFLINMLPWFLMIFVIWFVMIRQLQGTSNKALSFGKSRARLFQPHQKKITFKDVAGVEEAKQELTEIIDFLVNPGKFRKLGARIPKGVLLIGPPGTGKTLLARAVAGEANVPFFTISGSDFVEMFVGVGASRVRDLFEQGKKKAPCILFIDELDAVGRSRGAGYGGGHDEREQTLNQMLVEMDGFEANEGLILLAATNRPDVLDPALLRPGRFDRQVVVDVPDVKGREEILRVHVQEVPVSSAVDLSLIARGTPGFTGADLANMVNEAALLAARRDKKKIGPSEFEESKDKVLMGPERRSLVISESEKNTTAFHEAGHALLGYVLPYADPVHKVTIIPRGRALGLTQSLPIDERHTHTREYLLDQITLLMGGRVAEEFITGQDISTGAANDIEKATHIARSMVCEWGMSELMGPLSYGQKEQPIFIGKEIARHKDYSEKTAEMIDVEIRKIVDTGLARARSVLKKHRRVLDELVKTLLDKEVLDAAELQQLMSKHKVVKDQPLAFPARSGSRKKSGTRASTRSRSRKK